MLYKTTGFPVGYYREGFPNLIPAWFGLPSKKALFWDLIPVFYGYFAINPTQKPNKPHKNNKTTSRTLIF